MWLLNHKYELCIVMFIATSTDQVDISDVQVWFTEMSNRYDVQVSDVRVWRTGLVYSLSVTEPAGTVGGRMLGRVSNPTSLDGYLMFQTAC